MDISFVFGQPFAEQVKTLKDKVSVPTPEWDALRRAAHDRAFTVAGAMQAELLQDLRTAVEKAATDGQGLAWFEKEFNRIVQTRGWTGFAGEGSARSRAWRARVIYETNMRTSYARGRYVQMTRPEVLKARPYWRWRHNSVSHARAEHKSWDGRVLVAQHPWFMVRYPPCAWGCKCEIESLSDFDLAQMGKSGPDPDPMDRPYDYVVPKTGEVVQLPEGVGYNWDYPPEHRWHPDLEAVDADIARAVVKANVDEVFITWVEDINERVAAALKLPDAGDLSEIDLKLFVRKQLARGDSMAVGILDDAAKAALGTPKQVVLLSDDTLIKQAISRSGQGFDVAEYRFIQPTLEQAQWVVKDKEFHLFFEATTTITYAAVVKVTENRQELYLQSFRKASKDEAKRLAKKGTVVKSPKA